MTSSNPHAGSSPYNPDAETQFVGTPPTDADATAAYPTQPAYDEGSTAQYETPDYDRSTDHNVMPGEQRDTADTVPDKAPPVKRGTSDLALLLLRVALGVLLLGAGARQLFGWFDGPGITEFTATLEGAGYRFPGVSAYVASITELVAGGLLVLGLLTPLAAAAALVTLINAWLLADLVEPGFRFFAVNGGQQYEMLTVTVAAVVTLSGPGRYSLDFGRGWATRPFIGSFVALLGGIGGGLAAWFVLNGTTPFS